jgi:IclR family KDG regulon transcriptional repressor
MKNDYTVPAVHRAIQVIEMLAAAHEPISLAEVSKRLGVPKSSMFRILLTLEQRSIVIQDHDRKVFALGMKLLDWGNAALEKIDLKTIAHPHLLRLAHETKESFYLTILDDSEVIIIDRADSPEVWKMVARLGQRSPVHATASGQVLIADLNQGQLDKIIDRVGLKKYTPKTIVSLTKLRKRIADVRTTGFAIADREYKPDLFAAAVPIYDHRGSAVAALMTALPSERVEKNKNLVNDLLTILTREAGTISREIGYPGKQNGVS